MAGDILPDPNLINKKTGIQDLNTGMVLFLIGKILPQTV
jgi:hypothetical protein